MLRAAEPASIRARAMVGAFAGLAVFGALACEPIAPVPAELENGVYCLTEDVDAGFVVAAFQLHSNTTLDCQGHRIRDSSGAASFGVYALGADNVVVRNCIFSGFYQAIEMSGSPHYRIVDNLFIDAKSWASIETMESGDGLIARNIFRSPVPRGSSYEGWEAARVDGTTDIIANTVAIGSDPTAVGARRNGFTVGRSVGVIAFNVVQAQLGPGQSGVAIDPSFSIVYRNVMVSAPAADWLGMLCYNNEGNFFQNIIVGSRPSLGNDCSTNIPSGLKAGSLAPSSDSRPAPIARRKSKG